MDKASITVKDAEKNVVKQRELGRNEERAGIRERAPKTVPIRLNEGDAQYLKGLAEAQATTPAEVANAILTAHQNSAGRPPTLTTRIGLG